MIDLGGAVIGSGVSKPVFTIFRPWYRPGLERQGSAVGHHHGLT